MPRGKDRQPRNSQRGATLSSIQQHQNGTHDRQRGGEGQRDYFSRSLTVLRYACDALRIKSACVDTSFSTHSEPRSLAVSSSSLSTPSNIFSYASSQMRPFSLLNASTRSLVFLIRSAAASTSGVKFGVLGVTFGVAGAVAAAFLAGVSVICVLLG